MKLLANVNLDVNGKHTVSGEESDCSSLLSSTTCTTNTMDIILRIVRVVIVEHMSNVSDIFIDGLARTEKIGIANGPGRLMKKLHLNASNTLSATGMKLSNAVLCQGR